MDEVTGAGDVIDEQAEAAEEGDVLGAEGTPFAILVGLVGGSDEGDRLAAEVEDMIGQRRVVFSVRADDRALPGMWPHDAHWVDQMSPKGGCIGAVVYSLPIWEKAKQTAARCHRCRHARRRSYGEETE